VTDRFLRNCAVAIALFAVVLFAGIRYRLRAMPLERDEGEYAYVGQLMLEGIPPYESAYTMKLPGTHAAYAVIMKVFGETASGIHLGFLAVNAATTLLLFLLCSRLFGDLAAGVAAASYALLSTSIYVLGLAAHATHLVVLAAVAGLLVLQEAIDARRMWLLFASGVLIGLAALMKQPGVFFLAFGALYLLRKGASRSPGRQARVASMAVFLLAGTIPFAIVCLLMLKLGIFQKFWFWVFTYAAQYGSEVPAQVAVLLFARGVHQVAGSLWWIWLIALVGLTAPLWCKRAREHAFFTTLLLLFSFLAVCPGLYFRPHYFILILPAVAMLIGLAVSCATEKLLVRRGSRVLAAVPLLAFLAAWVFAVSAQRYFFLQMEPLTACRDLYPYSPFVEAPDVAAFLERLTPPGARIAVLGSEPEIYFYSHRRAATGYLYTYSLLESQKYVRDMQNEMIAEIEAARPEYLIYVDVPTSWAPNPHPDLYVVDWAIRYLRQNCELVTVDHGLSRALHVPETDSINDPLGSWNVYVYKRKGS